jgi:signal transduction histidine kinase
MKGDLQQRVPVSGSGDEFDRLSRNLNAMLAQIDRLMLAMREVTDNVAHDLRSPLTRLKSRLEVTLLSQKTTEEYRRALEQSVVETDKILSTFNALLSIAQAEAGSVGDNSDRVEIDGLIADIVELYEPVAEARDIEMTIKLGKAGSIKGDRHLLFQAAANLVDNAVKYSPDGGKVLVETRRAADPAWIEIVVGDGGLGIPEADRPRVIERFVRLEQSRTTPGNGLGLSLVSAVMHRHDGKLILEDNEPGLRAILRLRAG